MKNASKLIEKSLAFAGLVPLALMLFITFASLLEWWGIFWFSFVWAVPILAIAVVTVVFRFLSGSWSTVFLWIGGLFSGCLGFVLLAIVLMIFPLAYRFVEGEWPIAYLASWGILIVISLVQDALERLTRDAPTNQE